ncbi:MAG: SpoIIE family protein phosphatase [Treponema sp.]|jgi:PAS domain S-box-containing protein|nr:SpoIIE family protein phosphatase [Treponema sp.]
MVKIPEYMMRTEDHLHKAINFSPIGYLYVIDGIIQDLNMNLKNNWGAEIGKPVAEYYIDPNDLDTLINTLVTNNSVYRKIINFRTKNEKSCRHLINAKKTERQDKIAYSMWVVNLGENKTTIEYKIEVGSMLKNLSEQNQMQQALLDTIPHPVFYKGADTRFFGFNKAYGEVFGVNTRDLLGKRVLDLEYLSMEDRMVYQAEDERVINENSHTSYEMPMPFADGKIHETLYSVTGFKMEDGTPGGLVGIFIDITDIREAQKALEAATGEIEEHHKTIMDSINYARKIQMNLLPPNSALARAFSDYSVIWKPRDVVGGDIYWMKQFDKGTILCVCDCTGHGTPGALLTMLVVSTLESVVWPSNCMDTAGVIWALEQMLVDVFSVKASDREANDSDIKDGCDLAVLFIAKDGNVTLSSGHMNVFVCGGTELRRIRGQRIFVGEGGLKSKDDIKTIRIPFDSRDKFYIASDGLFDQPGGSQGAPFGYKHFEKIIVDNHHEQQSVISGKVWEAFEAHRGSEPRVDDFALITFKL